MKKLFLLTIFYLLITIITGCGSNLRLYVHPDADFSYIKKVAVIPFVNFTNHKFVSEKVTDYFITELLIAKHFDVVEPGEVSRIMKKNTVNLSERNNEIDLPAIQKIGKELNVQALIVGSISQYEMVSISQGQYPAISINIRLVDVTTGKIAWMGSYTDNGAPSEFLLFSWGEIRTLPEITQFACRKMVKEIIKRTY